jgi:undecaprenyl-phosphate 4-deoxy-4-formamido-L-arabinose transferase
MKISFVIPCYRSEKTVGGVIAEIIQTVEKSDYDYEIICVNDCSPDDVWRVLKDLAGCNPKIKAISLAKNMNKPSARMAGFNYATGDYVVSVDDDGQCPVDKLFDLMKPLSEGYDVALAKYPKKKQSAFKNFGSWLNSVMAQAMINKPKDLQISNFSVSKKFVIDEIIKYDLPYPYFSGLLLRTTRKIVNVPMEERSRKEGKSTFTFAKLVAMWMNGLTAFSVKPLRLASIIGCLYAFLGFLYGGYTIFYKLTHHALPKGYSSTMTVNMFTYGIILLMLGLMGEYLGRIYICINKSPQYVIKETANIEKEKKEE